MVEKSTNKILDKVSEAFDELNGKIRNPFVLSYLVSVILYNWKPLSVFIRSDIDIFEIINRIENPSYSYNTFWSFVIPLIIALFYTFGLPFIDALRSNTLDKTESIKLNSIDSKLKSHQKLVQLENAKSDFKNKSELNGKIENLKNQLNEENKKNDNLESDKKNLNLELDRLSHQIELKEAEYEQLTLNLRIEQKEKQSLIDNYKQERKRLETEQKRLVNELKVEQKERQSFIEKFNKRKEEFESDRKRFLAEGTERENNFLSTRQILNKANIRVFELENALNSFQTQLSFTKKEKKEFDQDYYNDVENNNNFLENFSIQTEQLLKGINLNEPNYLIDPVYMNIGLVSPIKINNNVFHFLTKKGRYYWSKIYKD